jgi:DNA invertase Pin-like site-specific DNA recombinase
MLICYMRVSTGEQNLDLQHDALERAGCERIYDDICSGRVTTQPVSMMRDELVKAFYSAATQPSIRKVENIL